MFRPVLLSMACPVWFHFTSARPRDGLASFASRSLTSASRPSSFLVHHRPPCALLFSVLFFLLLFFVLFSLLSVLRFFFLVPTCARFAFRFMSRRKLTEKEQEKSETSPIFVFGICYFVSSSLSLLRRIFSVCACDERRFSLVKEREREITRSQNA